MVKTIDDQVLLYYLSGRSGIITLDLLISENKRRL